MRTKRSGIPSARELWDLDQKAFPESHWSIQDFEAELKMGHLITLEDSAGALCGLLLYRVGGDVADLMHLSVFPHRRGYGRELILRLFDALTRQSPQIKRVVLEVKVDNLPARALYEHLGFCRIGTREKYYRDGKDALVLEKWLNPAD